MSNNVKAIDLNSIVTNNTIAFHNSDSLTQNALKTAEASQIELTSLQKQLNTLESQPGKPENKDLISELKKAITGKKESHKENIESLKKAHGGQAHADIREAVSDIKTKNTGKWLDFLRNNNISHLSDSDQSRVKEILGKELIKDGKIDMKALSANKEKLGQVLPYLKHNYFAEHGGGVLNIKKHWAKGFGMGKFGRIGAGVGAGIAGLGLLKWTWGKLTGGSRRSEQQQQEALRQLMIMQALQQQAQQQQAA